MDNRRQIILDTETTGLYPNAAENPDRLIEFAGLEMRNRSFTDEKLHLYVHPQRDIPAEAAAPQPADHLPRPAGVKLKVLAADSEERAAHEAFLDQIDKSCGGISIYRADAGSAQQ